MKFLTIFIPVVIFVIFAVEASAQTPTVSLLQRNARTQVSQPNSPTAGTLQTKSIAEIDRRIQVLNAALTTLNNIQFLSATEKEVITQKAQAELANLNTLKQKITANTDQTMLRNDVNLVSTSHRTFAFLFPQIRVLAAADALNSTANMLFDFAEKLEARIAEAAAAGNDVSRLETQLASMKSQITSAQTITTSIMSAASSASSEGTTGRSALVSAARSIKQAAANLRAAFQTGNQIRIALSELAPATTPETPVGSSSANPAAQQPVPTY